jgi:transposase InsO family protein
VAAGVSFIERRRAVARCGLARGVKLKMDGKGRCLDNIFVERLWRTNTS